MMTPELPDFQHGLRDATRYPCVKDGSTLIFAAMRVILRPTSRPEPLPPQGMSAAPVSKLVSYSNASNSHRRPILMAE